MTIFFLFTIAGSKLFEFIHCLVSYYMYSYHRAINIIGFYFFTAGSTSHFVRVSHGTNRIICTFMNQQDMSIKSCNVSYAQCGQQQTQLAYSVESAFQLVVDLKLADPIKYCYNVTASNSTFSVLIEGSILGSKYSYVCLTW